MKYVDTIFRNYKIKKLCKENHIKDYSINKDGSIDVNGDVYGLCKDSNKIAIKFNRVYGNFSCSNLSLRTLENAPRYVSGHFSCDQNYLISLEHSPEYVGDRFSCGNNNLTTLIGGPARVGLNKGDNYYHCQFNQLKDVYGFPTNSTISGIFIENNPVCEVIYLCTAMRDKIKFIYWLNEYQVIRNGNTIVEDRLEEALEKVSINWNSIKKYNKLSNYRLI